MTDQPKSLVIPLLFVSVVRFGMARIGKVVTYPVVLLQSYLPNNERASWIDRLCTKVRTWFEDTTPEWVELHGQFTIIISTTRGQDRLEAFANSIPDWLYDRWHQFALVSMVGFLVSWAVGMVILTVVSGVLTAAMIPKAIAYVTTVDWQSLFQTGAQPDYSFSLSVAEVVGSIPDILVGLGAAIVALLVLIVLFAGVMLLFMPGLILHEFGHYASIEHGGGEIERYGIIFIGPFLGGAFVDPGESMETMNLFDKLYGLSAGVANTVIWGTMLTVGGLVLVGNPITIVQAWLSNEYSVLLANPVGTGLLLIGFVEFTNAQLNSFPGEPIDGGKVIDAAEDEYEWKPWLGSVFGLDLETATEDI
jgi:hypothetical protein